MGTTVEWMRVLEVGGIWGVLIFLSGLISKRESFARVLSLAALVLGSLLFGMFMVFGWHALHGAVGVVFAIAVIGFFVTVLAERRSRKRTQIAPKIP